MLNTARKVKPHAAILLLSCLSAVAGDVFTAAEKGAVDQFLQRRFSDRQGAMVIGLLDRSGSVFFSAGNLANGTVGKPGPDTIFEMGSVTKTLTSLLALQMERAGEVRLEDPVARYLPKGAKVPSYQGAPITIRNLAAQDSGLPFNPDNFEPKHFPASYDSYTAELLYEFLARFQLTNAPGTKFQYSNTGMALLGHALGRAAGKSYDTLIQERIARPLDIKDLWREAPAAEAHRLAQGHDREGKPHPNLKLQVFAGAGNLKSTANGMLKFVAANLGFSKSELTPLIKRMHEERHRGAPIFGNTAMPWVDGGVYQPQGSRLLGHAGGTGGASTFVGFDLKQRRGVVVLSSDRSVVSAPIGWTILQSLPLTPRNTTVAVREIVGIGTGLAIDESTGWLKITTVFPDSSAGRAGLKVGQLIKSINGVTVKGQSIGECLKLLGGKEGSRAKLELVSSRADFSRTVVLVRSRFLTAG